MLQQMWSALGFDECARLAAEEKCGIREVKKNDVVIALVGSGVETSHLCFCDMKTDLNLINRKHEDKFLSIPYYRKVFGSWNFTREAKQEYGVKVFTSKSEFLEENYSNDITGHGTACASMAAGVPYKFKCLSVEGVSSKTIHGANPNARITSYKIGGSVDQVDFDIRRISKTIMDMFDKIIADQPDVLSVPFGSYSNKERLFLSDPYGRGSLLALDKKITTCQAAGHTGPGIYSTLTAPWIISVGACTPGGRFQTAIEIEEFAMKKVMGFGSLNRDTEYHDLVIWRSIKDVKDQLMMPRVTEYVYQSDVDYEDLRFEELKTKLEDKIILFYARQAPYVEKLVKVGVKGIIKACEEFEFRNFNVTSKVPFVHVSYDTGAQIVQHYLTSRENNKPVRIRFEKTIYQDRPHALCAKSSVGPNKLDSNILKPDVCAYGDELLTASTWNDDNQYANSQIFSGTSIACAMVAGVASYIKSIHKDWDSSRIKSAIMSTAKEIPVQEFQQLLGIGAGLVNPIGALDPGLSYDVTRSEYIQYLIMRGEDIEGLGIEIPSEIKGISGMDLNTCSFTTELKYVQSEYVFKRRLTNLCSRSCAYKGEVTPHDTFPYNGDLISFKIDPDLLVFSEKDKVLEFTLTVIKKVGQPACTVPIEYARLVWTEVSNDAAEDDHDMHIVSSPIILTYQENIFAEHVIAQDSKKRERSPNEPSGGPTKKHKQMDHFQMHIVA